MAVDICGHAVIDGVIFYTRCAFAVAIRRPTGEIIVRDRPWLAHNRVKRALAPLFLALEGIVFSLQQNVLHPNLAPAVLGGGRGILPHVGPKRRRAQKQALGLVLLLIIWLVSYAVLPAWATHIWLNHKGSALMSHGALIYGGLGVNALVRTVALVLCPLLMRFLPGLTRLGQLHGAKRQVLATWQRTAGLTSLMQLKRRGFARAAFWQVIVGAWVHSLMLPVMGTMALSVWMTLFLSPLVVALSVALSSFLTRGRNGYIELLFWPAWPGASAVRPPDEDALEVAQAAFSALMARQPLAQDDRIKARGAWPSLANAYVPRAQAGAQSRQRDRAS